MTILQSFAHYAVDIFNRLISLLSSVSFDGIPLLTFFVVSFCITILGVVWGFDFD